MGELRTSTPEETIDICGRVCPYTLVLTKKALEGVERGKILKVICDHQPAAEDTIPTYCRRQGYEFETLRIKDSLWEIYIRKA